MSHSLRGTSTSVWSDQKVHSGSPSHSPADWAASLSRCLDWNDRQQTSPEHMGWSCDRHVTNTHRYGRNWEGHVTSQHVSVYFLFHLSSHTTRGKRLLTTSLILRPDSKILIHSCSFPFRKQTKTKLTAEQTLVRRQNGRVFTLFEVSQPG